MQYLYLTAILFSLLCSDTIFVPEDHGTIQEAIDASVDGDTISVANGTYNETLSIQKSINLIGEPGAIIDASGSEGESPIGAAILIGHSDESLPIIDGVEVSGFEIIGNLYTICGIQISPASYNIDIRNNIIHGMQSPNLGSAVTPSYGILSYGLSDNFRPDYVTISNNEIYNILGLGISFGSYSSNAIVEGNHIHDIIPNDLELSIGVNAQFSSNLTISNNNFENLAVAISQTFVQNSIISADNLYNNLNCFYAVDQASYNYPENITLDTNSFGTHVQSYFGVPQGTFIIESIGWFTNISDAIEYATEGSDVMVTSGTFNENLVWPDRDIRLIGAGADLTTINGDNTDRVVKFESSNISSESLIQGFTIQGGNGGVLTDNGASPTINYNLITNNQSAENGGGITCNNSSPTLTNNTIYGNTASGNGGGVYLSGTSDPIITHTIVWGNTLESLVVESESNPTVSYSNIEGGYLGNGNIDQNPLFCDSENFIFTLADNSPCILESGEFIGTYDIGNCGNITITCDDSTACNTGAEGECEYSEDNYDCDGNCISDIDCLGQCGGTADFDECGVCGGNNSTCSDCAGTPNGDAVEDNCGTCDSDASNDCVQDCAGTWGGTAVVDECGVCGGDGPEDNFDCEGNCLTDFDECGVCGGDGSSCQVAVKLVTSQIHYG